MFGDRRFGGGRMARAGIDVDAPSAVLMQLLTDLPRMAKWSGANSVEVLESDHAGRPLRASWSESYLPLLTDEFTLRYTWHSDKRVAWVLERGRILKHEDGEYILTDRADDTTHVELELTLGIAIWTPPLARAQLEKQIIKSTLESLKAQAESDYKIQTLRRAT